MSKNQFHFPSGKASNYRCANGFAAVLLVSLLPVLISLGLIVPLGLQILQIQKAQRHECRMGLLRYQTVAKETIQQMQAMNIQARLLRAQRLAAMAMLFVPQSSAEGFRQLNKVNQQQKQLDRRQKAALRLGKMRMLQSLRETNRKIRHVEKPNLFQISTSPSLPATATLAIRPDVMSDQAPVYVFEKDFTRKQTQQISWKSEFSFAGDKLWTKWTGFKSIKQAQSCAATLTEKKEKVSAELIKAKFLPSFSSPLFF